MAAYVQRWDFFLAHAGVDTAVAEELFGYLSPHCRVFLDSQNLLPRPGGGKPRRDGSPISRPDLSGRRGGSRQTETDP